MILNHIALVSSSEIKADKFYKDVLGLEKTRKFSVPKNLAKQIFNLNKEYQVIVYSHDNLKIEVFIGEEELRNNLPLRHIGLEIEDREALIAKCQAMNIKAIKVPKGNSFYLFIKDDDDNLFEIKEKSKLSQ
ncbi:MAG: VOC family protein [Candidatus Aminicenantia bacterium]